MKMKPISGGAEFLPAGFCHTNDSVHTIIGFFDIHICLIMLYPPLKLQLVTMALIHLRYSYRLCSWRLLKHLVFISYFPCFVSTAPVLIDSPFLYTRISFSF